MKENTESNYVKAIKLVHKSWKQVLEYGCSEENTIEQAKAYYTASAVIGKIQEELFRILADGEEKLSIIRFDEKGHLI